MSAQPADETDLLTVDELAAATGMTVRTTRYYAGLGLLPAPERRGRMAYYGPEHRARLELIRSLQDHGFTLAALERGRHGGARRGARRARP
jgi:DNA-binding transcriptional MerR regulator